MRVVVTGATGNLGTAVVRALADDEAITDIVGIARREPEWQPAITRWVTLDLADRDEDDRLVDLFRGADAVVHLAWQFHPTRHPVVTWRSNVLGSIEVFRAAQTAEVGALIHTSSVGAYSPTRGTTPVSEQWPTHALPTAAYGREKSYLERVLDAFELQAPGVRLVRIRPAFVFQPDAAAEQRRVFAGPLLPKDALTSLPVVPDIPGLAFQAVHADDVAAAFRAAVVRDVRGPFNVAADPVLDAAQLADLLGARVVPMPAALATAGASLLWHLRAIPATPGLLRLLLSVPILDTTRARDQLDWTPRHSGRDAIQAFVDGLRAERDAPTPPLDLHAGGRGRWREFTTGVGGRNR